MKLTMETAKNILEKYTTEPHLFTHPTAVSAAMGAMARHFGEDEGTLVRRRIPAASITNDIYGHLQHTEEILAEEGISSDAIRAILSHGYSLCRCPPGNQFGKKPLYCGRADWDYPRLRQDAPARHYGPGSKSVMKNSKDKNLLPAVTET